MLKITIYCLLLLICASPALKAQPFDVWPGDANNNGIANHVDLLQIGISFDSIGPVRSTVSTVWAPQLLTNAWGLSALVNVDRGYGDCDGDGHMDAADVQAIRQNFGLFWTPTPPIDSSTLVTTPAPQLTLDVVDSVFVSGLDTVDLNILLGDNGLNLNGLYGLAFTISYDPTIVDTVLPTFTGGWINADGQALIVQHIDTLLGRIHIGITRRDGAAVNGNGYIGSLGIVMDEDIRISALYQLEFQLTFATANTRNGAPIYLGVVGDTMKVATPVAVQLHRLPHIELYPSPARGMLYLQTDGLQDADLRVVDARGIEVHHAHFDLLNRYPISVANWPAGIYFLEIRNKEGFCRAKVCVGANE